VLQYAVRTGAAGRRSVAVHVGPWQAAAAGEPRGTPVRRVAPWPEAPLGGPSPAVALLDEPWQVVPLVGLLRLLGRDLFPLGRTSRCSPQLRRH